MARRTTATRIRHRTRFVACIATVLVLAASCGDATEEPTAPTTAEPSSPDAIPTEPDPAGTAGTAACDLMAEVEAEAALGTDLELHPITDEFLCTYIDADDPTVAATVTLRPFTASPEDIAMLHDVFPEGTLEDLEGIGEAAVYYQEQDILHSLQFVKSGVYVTVIVTGLADGDDLRGAETTLATSIAAKL